MKFICIIEVTLANFIKNMTEIIEKSIKNSELNIDIKALNR